MAKRIIKLGNWCGQPLEWIVLKEESYGVLVICKDRIGTYRFDENNNCNWGSSSLRKFLNRDFFEDAFNNDEKSRIVNVSLDRTKDDVFLITEEEMKGLLPTNGNDPYEDAHYSSCSYCCWTRSNTGSKVRQGYCKGCWCSQSATTIRSVRPAMYIREK